MDPVRRLLCAGWAALLALTVSCGKREEVRHYQAPKDPMWRMLGAVVPAKNDTWFFKLVGPSTRIAGYKEEFVAFLQSFQVAEGVTWKLPAGWSEEKGKGDRKSTLRLGREEPLLEVTVTSFAGDAGGLQPNLNRWRGQLGLSPTAEATGTTTLAVGGATITVADFEGPKMPAMGAPMMQGPRPQPKEEARQKPDLRSMFLYQVPSGWTDNPEPQGDRILELRAGDVLVTLTAFAGQTGDLASNVNRGREQAGRGPVEPGGAIRLCKAQILLNREGYYVEILGSRRGIVCAFILDRGGSMFLKMDGPPDAVDRQKPAFHHFLQSLKVDKHG